jgi:predicted nucleotide-binding protein (sugar kinase/HSP70/actin superfamily)
MFFGGAKFHIQPHIQKEIMEKKRERGLYIVEFNSIKSAKRKEKEKKKH